MPNWLSGGATSRGPPAEKVKTLFGETPISEKMPTIQKISGHSLATKKLAGPYLVLISFNLF